MADPRAGEGLCIIVRSIVKRRDAREREEVAEQVVAAQEQVPSLETVRLLFASVRLEGAAAVVVHRSEQAARQLRVRHAHLDAEVVELALVHEPGRREAVERHLQARQQRPGASPGGLRRNRQLFSPGRYI